MTELKPCPFCGGEAEYSSTIDEDWGYVSHFVTCKNNCLDGLYSMGNTKKQAIEAWNNRSSPWNTGTPTEEGWYLLKLNHDGESKYNANYLWDIGFGKEWKYAYLGEVVKWQKIEGGEELDG